MFLLREVRPADLDDLEVLAEKLNTLNLPADRDVLKQLINYSRASFGGKFDKPEDRQYIFVLRDIEADRVIGTCMIIAQHGSYERPSVYFQVRDVQNYSSTIKKHFHHQTLQIQLNFDGPTEIGGLILHPEYRGHRLKLGKMLAFVRFLYIGMRPDLFQDEIVAELLPELNSDGTSDLWNHLGEKFTGLDYMTADKMSRENIEFVRSLFPFEPMYTSLLPAHVKAKIGKVGTPTKPIEKMLKTLGFQYDHSIDPFDGGPTFRARARDCEAVHRTSWQTFVGPLDEDGDHDGLAMVGFEYEAKHVRFRATVGKYKMTPDGIKFISEGIAKLRCKPGDLLGFMPLTGPELLPLY